MGGICYAIRPATTKLARPAGELSSEVDKRTEAIFSVICLLIIIASLLYGSFGEFMLGIVISVLIIKVIEYANERARERCKSIRVERANGQAWRLCDLALKIAEVGAWRDKTVDGERRVAPIVWSAVERSLVTESQYEDACRALDHANLQDLASDTIEKVRRERESLNEIEANLGKILSAAQRIDEQRARKAEEQELLDRLAGDRGRMTDTAVSDRQADRSAGMAAEAEAIADWLAETDHLLQTFWSGK